MDRIPLTEDGAARRDRLLADRRCLFCERPITPADRQKNATRGVHHNCYCQILRRLKESNRARVLRAMIASGRLLEVGDLRWRAQRDHRRALIDRITLQVDQIYGETLCPSHADACGRSASSR